MKGLKVWTHRSTLSALTLENLETAFMLHHYRFILVLKGPWPVMLTGFLFPFMGFYVSDSLYGSVFFFLSGLHFFHVLLGLVILGILSTFPNAFGLASFHFFCTIQDLYFTVQVMYWHFVEVVWLFIILVIH